jgi:hypothetical protein
MPGTLMIAFIMIMLALVAVPQAAFALHAINHHHHRLLHSYHFRGLRGILWNPMFRPSHNSLLRQNEEINRLDLPAYKTTTNWRNSKLPANWCL